MVADVHVIASNSIPVTDLIQKTSLQHVTLTARNMDSNNSSIIQICIICLTILISITSALETLVNPYFQAENSSCIGATACWDTVICGIDEECLVLCKPFDPINAPNRGFGCWDIPFEFYSYSSSIKCIQSQACNNVIVDAFNTSQLHVLANTTNSLPRSFITSSAINATITCEAYQGIII